MCGQNSLQFAFNSFITWNYDNSAGLDRISPFGRLNAIRKCALADKVLFSLWCTNKMCRTDWESFHKFLIAGVTKTFWMRSWNSVTHKDSHCLRTIVSLFQKINLMAGARRCWMNVNYKVFKIKDYNQFSAVKQLWLRAACSEGTSSNPVRVLLCQC